MRNILVPQVGHVPCVAGRPFFNVTCWAFEISLFALHFTQYPWAIFVLLASRSKIISLQAHHHHGFILAIPSHHVNPQDKINIPEKYIFLVTKIYFHLDTCYA